MKIAYLKSFHFLLNKSDRETFLCLYNKIRIKDFLFIVIVSRRVYDEGI